MQSKNTTQQDKSKSEFDSVPFTVAMFNNICNILRDDLNCTTDLEICSVLGFNNKNFSSIKSAIAKKTLSVKRKSFQQFIILGYNFLKIYHSHTHPFNESTKTFKVKSDYETPLFKDGQYYGTFQGHNQGFFHFIMLVDGMIITVTSEFGGITVGELRDNQDTYYAVLSNEEKTVTNFIMGLKIPTNPTERIFIATWYTTKQSPDHLINSALCIAIHISNPEYKTLEAIEEARRRGKVINKTLIHNEINSKLDEEVFDKLKRKTHNHICQTEKE